MNSKFTKATAMDHPKSDVDVYSEVSLKEGYD